LFRGVQPAGNKPPGQQDGHQRRPDWHLLASRAPKKPTPPVFHSSYRPEQVSLAPISDAAESVPEMTVVLKLSAIPQEKLRQNG
jgi:hypothetical protein